MNVTDLLNDTGGSLSSGTPEEEVRRVLGSPSEVALRKGRPSILRYGSLQVFLRGGGVAGFAIYFDQRDVELPSALVLDVPLWSCMSEQEALACLARAGVAVVRDARLSFEDQTAYQTSSGVSIVFDKKGLHSIQRVTAT